MAMNDELFEILGLYEPGFLHLQLNTENDISDLDSLHQNKSTQIYFCTFLHEYIHFLQDITTPTGLMNAIFCIDLIKDINNNILKDDKNEFYVPVKINNEYNIEANDKLMECYSGEYKIAETIKYDSYSIEKEKIILKDREDICNKYRVYYYDIKESKYENFLFGSRCLMEYIAHAIQKKYMPNTEHPDIPYKIVEQIINKEYPMFGNDPMKIVALCDACLMCGDSTEMFFSTIKRMKKETFIPNNIKAVYDFIYNDLEIQGEIGIGSVESVYESFIKLTDKQFYDALKSPILQPNYEWLKYILEQAKNLRLDHPNFMSELIENEGKLSELFFDIFRKLGTPFITNKNYQGYDIPPIGLTEKSYHSYQLLVFKQIINVFYGCSSCSLYGFCKNRLDINITNEKCKTAPWERGYENELCPFGQLWKIWGLNGKIPIRRK